MDLLNEKRIVGNSVFKGHERSRPWKANIINRSRRLSSGFTPERVRGEIRLNQGGSLSSCISRMERPSRTGYPCWPQKSFSGTSLQKAFLVEKWEEDAKKKQGS